MNRAIAVILSLAILLASNHAFAFVDQIAVSPPTPHAGQPITISFRSGDCDGVDTPVVWELVGTGEARDQIVNGLSDLEPLYCTLGTGTTSIVIGSLPLGQYTIVINFRDIFDGLGGIPNPVGSLQFTVGQARPIPTIQPLGVAALAALLIGVVALGRRRFVHMLSIGLLAFCITPASDCQTQESVMLGVTLAPPPAPSPESVVEGYDFSSGSQPSFPSAHRW